MVPVYKTKTHRLIIVIIAAIAIATGLLVITGWLLNIESLKSVCKGFNSMKLNTSICITLSGINLALVLSNKPASKTVYSILSLVILVIGSLTLLQYLLQINTGIDQFFVADITSAMQGKPFPGRMSPSTSACFICLSVAFLLLRSDSRLARHIAQYALHVVTLLSFIAMIGYIYNMPVFYKLSFLVSMAIHTAAVLFLVSIAASLVNPSFGFTGLFIGNKIGNVMARRQFPWIVVLILVMTYLHILAHREGMLSTEFGIVLFGISFLLISLLIISNTTSYLNRIDLKRSEAESALIEMNLTLEDKVRERSLNLDRSEEKFFKAFQMSTAGMTLSDIENNKLLEVNQSFIDMIGYTKQETAERTSIQLGIVTPEQRALNIALLKKQGYLRNHEVKLITRHGEKTALMSIELLDVGDKKLALTVLHDITERKDAEMKMQEAKTIAEDAKKAQEQFLANMSHELRTPLNSILILSKLLSNNVLKNLTDKQTEQATVIHKAGNDLLTLINDILDLSKIEAGEVQVNLGEVNIPDIKENLTDLFSPLAVQKGIGFTIILNEGLPATILTDIQRLEQVLKNLLSNAFKFTDAGGNVSVNIDRVIYNKANLKSGVYRDGDAVLCFAVSDTGIGIATEKQENIFDAFKQADGSTSRKYGGTGLGLSISRKLAYLLGGEIILESELGIGSTFKVLLPLENTVAI